MRYADDKAVIPSSQRASVTG